MLTLTTNSNSKVQLRSSFLPFHIDHSLLPQWETRLPLSLIYLLIGCIHYSPNFMWAAS